MTTLIVSHDVANYDNWKKSFDADSANRDNAGLKTHAVLRSKENPDNVTLIFETPNVEMVQQMMGSPEMQQVMKDAGVVSEPKVSFFTKG